MSTHRTQGESSEETIRRLAYSSQRLAVALSDATRGESTPISTIPDDEPSSPAAAPSNEPPRSKPLLRKGLGRVGRFVAWPARRLLDARFAGLARQVDQKQMDLFDRLDQLRGERLQQNHEQVAALTKIVAMLEQSQTFEGAAVTNTERIKLLLDTKFESDLEATTIFGRALAQLRSQTEAQDEALDQLTSDVARIRELADQLVDRLTRTDRLEASIGVPVDRLDALTARFLNYATGHSGLAAQRGLWFNDPVGVHYEPGDVRAAWVNERIVEVPWVYRALIRLQPGARILDVGASESLVSVSLASMGYDVTAIDPRPYPLEHPNLRIAVGSIEDWETEATFDAVVCLSTIEHIGLGAYGEAPKNGRADLAAMERIFTLTRPGGLLVLTTRYGASPEQDWLQRTYNDQGLDQLLAGWQVEDLQYLRRDAATVWRLVDRSEAVNSEGSVVMVLARRP